MIRVLAGRRKGPVAMLRELRARYGEVVRIPMGATPYFIVSGVEGARHVLLENARNYSKGQVYALLATFLGEGLITAEGDTWRRHRRLVQPMLARDRMAVFTRVMAEEADAFARQLVDESSRGAAIDIFPRLLDVALRVVARAMLGGAVVGREGEVHEALTGILEHIERVSISGARVLELLPGGRRLRGLRSFLLRLPTRRNRQFRQWVAMLDGLIYGVIAERRARGAPGAADLVALLVAARDESTGAPLTDREVHDEVMTMFLAGHETVATGLAWALHLLSQHPDVADAVAAEGDAVLGLRPPSAEDLAALPLTERVFEEAMRLHPPVWRISRLALGPDRLGGYEVPEGAIIVVAPVLMHRDPAVWERPDEFDPARFTPERTATRPRFAFMPFGAGQRMCIGAAFAMAEAQIVLTAVCRAVRLTPTSTTDPAYEPSVTLRPRGGVRLILTPRPRRVDR